MENDKDAALVAAARDIIRRRYHPKRHVVGAALRSRSGRTFAAVHLEATVGRVAVCAEAIALGLAIAAEGDGGIESVVAVRHRDDGSADPAPEIVPPCGLCRELLSDYDVNADVILAEADGGTRRVPVSALLPDKYRH